MITILLVSGLLAVVINLLHPHRIPWVQDWSVYVETRARDAGIEVIPLRAALSYQQQHSHLFIDARPALEYATGHVPNALSIPLEEMDARLDSIVQILESSMPVVVYCSNRDCDDALLLAMALVDMGKTNLLYYVDGFDAWKKEGYPVEVE